MHSRLMTRAALLASAACMVAVSLPAVAQDYQGGPPPQGYEQQPPPGYNDGPPPGYNGNGPPPGYNQNGPPPGYDQNGPPDASGAPQGPAGASH